MSSIDPLRIGKFRSLWLASVVSNVGSFLQAVAAGWLMLELTRSPFWVGLMSATATLPLLFLALPAGALADMVDRRKLLLISQGLMGLSAMGMATLSFLDLITAPILLGLGLTLGVGLALNLPAWQAMVPDLVPRGLVASAVALNSVAFNVARAVGPALGGIIVATAGPDLAFFINGVSFIGVVAVIASWRGARYGGDVPDSLGHSIALGVRFARFTPAFRRLLFVSAVFALTSAVVQSLLPNLTDESLNGDALVYGFLLGAMGLGALIAAFTRSRIQEMFGRSMVPWSILGFGISGIIVGVSNRIWLTAAAMLIAGVFWVWTLATLNATVQLLAPAWIRGRAMSLYTLAFVGVLPIGSILGGIIGDIFGASTSVAALSVVGTIAGLVWIRVGVPRLGDVVAEEPPPEWDLEPHDVDFTGGPVMITNTWVIDEGSLAEFLEAMNRLRMVRLRTGAYRWRLYRNASDPHRMTEIFILESWQDHIRQHQRIDAEAAAAIREAILFDTSGGPENRHLVAVDVASAGKRPEWDELVAVHGAMHQRDGSIPLDMEPTTTTDPRLETQ